MTINFLIRWIRKWKEILYSLPYGSDGAIRCRIHIQDLTEELRKIQRALRYRGFRV